MSDDLTDLARDLKAAGPKLHAETRIITQVGAFHVKRDAQQIISGHPTLPAYPYSITYDTVLTLTGAEAVIGPDKDRGQGPLGNIIEYGTSEHPPIPHLAPALDREAPKFEQALAEAAEHLL